MAMVDLFRVDRSAPPDYAEALIAIHTLQTQLGRMAIKDPQRGDVSFLGLYGQVLAYIEADVEQEAVAAGYVDTVPPGALLTDAEVLEELRRLAARPMRFMPEDVLTPATDASSSVPQVVLDFLEARAEDDGSDEEPGAYQ
jgi:hypothetical protein